MLSLSKLVLHGQKLITVGGFVCLKTLRVFTKVNFTCEEKRPKPKRYSDLTIIVLSLVLARTFQAENVVCSLRDIALEIYFSLALY